MATHSSASTLPSESAMRDFLERVLPGRSPCIVSLRNNVLEFCASPTARALLLEGPIGSGKSTIARAIAALKRVAPLKHKMALEILKDLRFAGPNLIHVNSLPWYVELPLTGLSSELAEAQLFGSGKSAYTGAADRAGVFESAMLGKRKRGDAVPESALLTGGVVFLDEIGDLVPAHQAKLLPVLSGGVFYRLGEEGHDGKEIVFDGILITATWKKLSSDQFRADLLSRIAANRIAVPSLSDRIQDFPEILSAVELTARERKIRAIDKILLADKEADRDYWKIRREALPSLTNADRQTLADVDWAAYGNLRGLTTAIDLIMDRGISARDAVPLVARLEITGVQQDSDATSTIVQALLNRRPDGAGLASHVSGVEGEIRALLQRRLRTDDALRDRLAAQLEIEPRDLSRHIGELDRDRRSKK